MSLSTGQGRSRVLIRAPDVYDGKDPHKLKTFLLQCQLNFDHDPSYISDHKKVTYAISYLSGAALDWFEPHIVNPDSEAEWKNNYAEFIRECKLAFGPNDPVGSAERDLRSLVMDTGDRIQDYTTKFNLIAVRLDWGEAPLVSLYYDGLPDRLKDAIMSLPRGKPKTLIRMRTAAHNADDRHWERTHEVEAANKLRSRYNNGSSSSNRPGKPVVQTTVKVTTQPVNNAAVRPAPAKPDLSASLGPDGKLLPQERQRRLDLNLCLFCGTAGHRANDCRKRQSSAKARSAAALPVPPPAPAAPPA